MKVWVDSYLYTAGTPFRAANLEEIGPSFILDLRKRTITSHWYEAAMAEQGGECISLEIEQGKVIYDTGRAIKDKNITIKKLCQKMVNLLREKVTILILCSDGMSTSGYLAIIVRWWYYCSIGQVTKELDVPAIVAEVRAANDFTSARSKEQREQMVEVRAEALRIMKWESFVRKGV